MKIASKLTNYKFLHFFNPTTDSCLKKSDNRIPELFIINFQSINHLQLVLPSPSLLQDTFSRTMNPPHHQDISLEIRNVSFNLKL